MVAEGVVNYWLLQAAHQVTTLAQDKFETNHHRKIMSRITKKITIMAVPKCAERNHTMRKIHDISFGTKNINTNVTNLSLKLSCNNTGN